MAFEGSPKPYRATIFHGVFVSKTTIAALGLHLAPNWSVVCLSQT